MSTLVRFREPFRSLAALNGELDRLMSPFFETAPARGTRTNEAWAPALDVWETGEELVYAFDLPGIPESEISVELEDGSLTVVGRRERAEEAKSDRFYRYERRFGEFSRTVALPDGVGQADVTAHYGNGVLEVHVRKPEQPKPQRIPVVTTVEGKSDAA